MQTKLEGKKFVKFVRSKMKDFWLKNELKIVLAVGLVLVSGLSFEFGALQGQKWQKPPLIIEKTASREVCDSAAVQLPANAQNQSQNANSGLKKDCNLVGSKNSNKYHLLTCQWAKRIKPENVVCFKSAEDALAKHYQPDKGCIK